MKFILYQKNISNPQIFLHEQGLKIANMTHAEIRRLKDI